MVVKLLEIFSMLICDLISPRIRPLSAVYLVAIAVVSLGASGCGPSHPETAPVSGVVSFDGKPLAHVMVMFFPQDVTDARIGICMTNAEGKFTDVSTFGTGDGAVVGHHNVSVTEAWPPDIKEIPTDNSGMERSPPRGPWAAKYRDSTSGALQVDVIANENNVFEFELSK
jgi:hypothetical protein